MSIFEAFNMMFLGHTVKDGSGIWFKKDGNKLVDSTDNGKSWYPTDEFKYGYINQNWELVD